jgi:prepilin peptidase CpaA
MTTMPLPIWCFAVTTALVGGAMITDIRWRRIPNSLTFTALVTALLIRALFQGWAGLGLAIGGAVLAPTLLLVAHMGKGLGMGDVKLAMAIGAILGPVLAAVAMLVTTLVGGIMAAAIMTANGRGLAPLLTVLSIGLPFSRKTGAKRPAGDGRAPLTMPYGVAIGLGSLITLAVCWWTGQDTWFLSFVGIAGSR